MRKIFAIIACILAFSLSYAAEAPTFSYQINGVAHPLLTNVKASLAGLQSKNQPLTVTTIHRLNQQAPSAILKALQPYGYFKPHVQIHLQQQGTHNWQATYNVDLGPLLRISQLDLQVTGDGKNDEAIQQFFADFPLKVGQPLETQRYNQAKHAIFTVAEQQGYLVAQLSQHVIEVDLKHNTAKVILHLATGPRYYFGPTYFSKTPLQEKFLRRFMPYQQGDVYSTDKILALQDALSNSRYFQQVWVEPRREQAVDNQIPTHVILVPRPAHQYLLGAGFGTDTGPRGLLGWEDRYVNRMGHYFSSQLMVSPVQNSLQAQYTIPGKNPNNDQYNINASLLQINLKQGDSFIKQLGVSDVTALNQWQRTLSLNYQIEKFRFEDQAGESSFLLIPGINLLSVRTDNPIYTRHGNRINIRLQGAKQGWLSTTSFAQTEIQDKYIYSFTEKTRVLLRADLGYTVVHNLAAFPLSQRFYAGGTQSVRGYAYQSLGPGRYLKVGSAELQQQVVEKWYAVTFLDAGNASNHTNAKLMWGPGLGVMWRSPLGPMELTIAKGISKSGEPIQIQFTMGPDLG